MDSDDSDSSGELIENVTPNFLLNNRLNYTDPTSFSTIIKYVIVDNLQGIKTLINKGRSPNVVDNLGNTPLHVAIYLKRLTIIRYLLTLDDTLINAQNFQGETPLLYTVRYENIDALKLLLAANADVRIPTNDDVTPLHVAATRQTSLVAQLLLETEQVDINARDYSGDTPLNEAVKGGSKETVALLLYYNADATIPCSNHLSPFMNAIIRDDMFLQETLIEYETDFNRETAEGMTVLFLALTQGTPLTKEIIQRGADVNYHNVRNVLKLCVDLLIFDMFTLVWDKVDYEVVWCKKIPSILKQVASERKLNFLEHIIYSDQLKCVIQSSSDAGIIADIFSAIGPNYPRELAINATYVLLTAGYDPDESDLEYVFWVLGYCALYKVLLHMNIRYNTIGSDSKVFCLLPAILVNVSVPICATVDRFLRTPNRDRNNSRINLQFILPFVKHANLFRDLCGRTNYDDININLRNKLMCNFPSLLELARNKFRITVCLKHRINKSSQFYTLINHMDIPRAIKQIVNFEVPTY